MTDAIRIVDLTGETPSRVQSAAFYAVKDLRQGGKVVLLTAQEPTLLMRSLDLQLRHNLTWTVAEADGGWRIEVRHRADTAPRDVIELLMRDHKRLDGIFVEALRRLNRNDTTAAAPLVGAFAAALRRHIASEDRLLAPALGPSATPDPDSPPAVMLREHAEILQQLAVIEECLAGGAAEAGELGAYCAILSGTLAKHEHREESQLFPQWRRALSALPEQVRAELLSRAGAALED